MLGTLTPEGSGEDEYVGMLLDRKVSGIVFVSGLHADTRIDRSRYDDLERQGVPFVLVNGQVPGLRAPSLSCDDALAGRLAVQHLIRLGHRRIGFLSGPDRYSTVQRRLAGFRLTMRQLAGPGTGELIELASFDIPGGQSAATRLLERGATALVCGSDLMALGAIRAARRQGLRVPEDVSVVGADDSLLMPFTDPALTTVRQPVLAIGAAAARALAELVKGRANHGGERLFDPELVIRASTGPCPPGLG
ncbi:substrate-binding domain-containing protein [Thermocatellispora tengchongensis]